MLNSLFDLAPCSVGNIKLINKAIKKQDSQKKYKKKVVVLTHFNNSQNKHFKLFSKYTRRVDFKVVFTGRGGTQHAQSYFFEVLGWR